MNSNQRTDASDGFRSIVGDDVTEAFLREVPSLPATTLQHTTQRTVLPSGSLIESVLAQEERNQALANASLNRLNTSILQSNHAMNSLAIPSSIRNTAVPREATQTFLGAQPTQPNSAVREPMQSASDALNNIILSQVIRSQNSNSLLGATAATLNLHRSVGLLGSIMPTHMADMRTAAALGIGAANIGNEVELSTGSVANLESNVGPHNLAGIHSSNIPLLSAYNQEVQNSLRSNQVLHQHHQGLSQSSDMLSQLQSGSASSHPDVKRQGRPATFLKQVYQMLLDLEEQPEGTSIASFVQQGRAFAIHRSEDFVKSVIPKYFRMSCLSSFQRQLNMYGFRQLTSGSERGAYYHDRFVRGQPELLATIQRCRVTSKKKQPKTS